MDDVGEGNIVSSLGYDGMSGIRGNENNTYMYIIKHHMQSYM